MMKRACVLLPKRSTVDHKTVRALLAVPLIVGGERRGLLYVTDRPRGAFTRTDQALLTVVATRVGLLLENAELAQRRAERERERARPQVRQEFLGIVPYELKTPVVVIKAYTVALQQRAARPRRRGEPHPGAHGGAGQPHARPV